MNPLLEQLTRRQLIWRGADIRPPANGRATGFAGLDQRLGGGLPDCGVVEVRGADSIGELRLFLPALAKGDRLTVFIAPPGRVNAEMLAAAGFALERVLVLHPDDEKAALWAAEQCLKSGSCQGVLLWQRALDSHQVRRLQLAATEGGALQLVFRGHALSDLLPVSLSLQLSAHPRGLAVAVPRRRGGWPLEPFRVDMCDQWPALTLPAPAGKLLKIKRRPRAKAS